MKTALLALLFLAFAMVEARPGKCGGPGGKYAEVFEALADDNGVLEWFFLEADEDECSSSANADSPNEITIEAPGDREGRGRGDGGGRRRGGGRRGPKGGKGRKGPFRDASVEACADEDPAGENEICICQRIVSDTIADGTEYIQTCGRCEERGEDVLLDPESKREDREDIENCSRKPRRNSASDDDKL